MYNRGMGTAAGRLGYTERDLVMTAEGLLRMAPDPVPRYRIMKEILRLPSEDAEYRAAKRALDETVCVRLLRSSQLPDGTWGRFHTRRSDKKAPFPTTEIAISAALDSGLDAEGPLLGKTLKAVERYAAGRAEWPDPPEKHDNPLAWPVWERQVSAGVLAEISPRHPLLPSYRALWVESLRASFRSGSYDRQAEIQALNVLLGCRMKNPMPFHKKYLLLILSSGGESLPEPLERAALSFVLNGPDGIYYVCDGVLSQPRSLAEKRFWSWLSAHALLSRFPLWRGWRPGY
jgi:hypothetical protein